MLEESPNFIWISVGVIIRIAFLNRLRRADCHRSFNREPEGTSSANMLRAAWFPQPQYNVRQDFDRAHIRNTGV
jgi:hypothetical protein